MNLPLRLYLRWFLFSDIHELWRKAVARAGVAIRPWVHTPADGRGPRYVYLDGERIEGVVYADIRRGVVRCHYQPIRVNKRREVVRGFKRFGRVEVTPMGQM